MTKKFFLLSQMINAKLCHELSSTIGALNNCVQLIDSPKGKIRDCSRQIIRSSSLRLVHQLNFYRYIYGYSGVYNITFADMKDLTFDALGEDNKKITFEFLGNKQISIDITLAKLLMSLCAFVYNNSYSDDTLECILDCSNILDSKCIVRGSSNNSTVTMKKDKLNIISGYTNVAKLDICNCHEYYIRYLLSNSHYVLNLDLQDFVLIFSITPNQL